MQLRIRPVAVAAAAAALCSAATAQQPADVYPVTVPVRNAGTVNVVTGEWTRAANPTQNAGQTVIFNNTCTWSGGAFYAGVESCEDVYDEGRVPSPGAPNAPASATNTNQVACFEFAYCTFNANAFPARIGFWNLLNGPCVGGIPPTPPAPATTATAYFDLTPLGLPGSPANGVQACWIVTLDTTQANFVLASDGDQIFDNNPALDLFTWSFSHSNPSQAAGPDGILIQGDPNATPPGACTYSTPCGTDPFSGTPCGTGLGAEDNFWINVDGVAVGDTTSGLCAGGVAPIGGTNCYFFGGYPTNPFASFHMLIERTTGGSCPSPVIYCTPKVTSNGCVPSIAFAGTPTPTGNFVVGGTQIEGASIGVAFYSTSGANAQPFQGGFLCILPPVTRLPPKTTGGTFGTCQGTLVYPLTALVNQLGPNVTVWMQLWFRDNGAASGTGLSNAVQFTTCP